VCRGLSTPIARRPHLACGEHAGAEWVVTAYAITFGGLLILGGRIGDVFGRRRLFLFGLTVFSIASLTGGFAGSGAELVAARAAQGVGAALIAPTALALLATSFPEGPARNRALGMYGATASVGFVVGLVLGGILVRVVGWRAVLWVNVPIGLAAVMLGRMSLPADQRGRSRGRLDFVGAILVTLAPVASVCSARRRARQRWYRVRRDRGGQRRRRRSRAGTGRRVINSSRQIGAALGVTALMAVATSVTAHQSVPAAVASGAGYRAALTVTAALAAVALVVSALFVRSDHADRAHAGLRARGTADAG
jgi:MFS family permease